jgi:hypothetical protein
MVISALLAEAIMGCGMGFSSCRQLKTGDKQLGNHGSVRDSIVDDNGWVVKRVLEISFTGVPTELVERGRFSVKNRQGAICGALRAEKSFRIESADRLGLDVKRRRVWPDYGCGASRGGADRRRLRHNSLFRQGR